MGLIDSNVIAAVIGATVPTVAGGYQLLRNRREKQWQTYKFAFVKIVHLTQNTGPAVYTVDVPRLGRAIAVHDEVHYFRLNVYPRARKEFVSEDRSSGVVDLQILHPYQEGLHFTDEGARTVSNHLSQIVRGKSGVFFTRAAYYNGLQDGNEDMAMKMELDTREARMIVDFSSIIGHESLLRTAPQGRLVTSGGDMSHGVANPYPGVYSISATDLRKGDVLRINFAIAWDHTATPQVSATPQVTP